MFQDYCASKFAAVGFHESLAHELLAEEVEGVKTTLVCPYIVNTGMFEGCKIRYVHKLTDLEDRIGLLVSDKYKEK